MQLSNHLITCFHSNPKRIMNMISEAKNSSVKNMLMTMVKYWLWKETKIWQKTWQRRKINSEGYNWEKKKTKYYKGCLNDQTFNTKLDKGEFSFQFLKLLSFISKGIVVDSNCSESYSKGMLEKKNQAQYWNSELYI